MKRNIRIGDVFLNGGNLYIVKKIASLTQFRVVLLGADGERGALEKYLHRYFKDPNASIEYDAHEDQLDVFRGHYDMDEVEFI